jgi:anti-sigma regulatory factor (Ser/Thr protein kinase)
MPGMGEDQQALAVEARADNLAAVQAFIAARLEQAGIAPAVCQQLHIVVEEIYTNIVKYAYPDRPGAVAVVWRLAAPEGRLILEFRDKGVPYDPWARPDPDISLSAEKRGIGGLGLFMVKKLMDAVDYRYEGGENVVILEKRLET